MKRRTTDELRDQVWAALVKFAGDRVKAAEFLGKSKRTLDRYIEELNLYPDMDKAGMMRNAGPPRGVARGTSTREGWVFAHIKKNKGEIDYGMLATEMYGSDNDKTRHRVYTALNEMKMKGQIAIDGVRWFILG